MRFICTEVNIVRRRGDPPDTRNSRASFEEEMSVGGNFVPQRSTINLALTADDALQYAVDAVYEQDDLARVPE